MRQTRLLNIIQRKTWVRATGLSLFGIVTILLGIGTDRSVHADPATASTKAVATNNVSTNLSSGIDLTGFADSKNPGEDFYEYVNGRWMAETKIPSDQSRWGAFSILDETVKEKVRELIEKAGESKQSSGPSQQIGDFYRSYINVEARNAAGLNPIKPLLAKILSVNDLPSWSRVQGELDRVGVPSVVGIYIDQDAKKSDEYAVHVVQNGLTLPDRDYYLVDEARYRDALAALQNYIHDLLIASGTETEIATSRAKDIVDFEKAIANLQWSQVELRDPVKSYNKVNLASFLAQHPNLEWSEYYAAVGLKAEGDLIVGQPSYFKGLDSLLKQTDIATLKAYTQFRIVDSYANVLDEKLEKRHFDFHETALSGVTEQEPLWKRGVRACNGLLGMPVGQLYVAENFPPQAKERMLKLVEGLKAVFAIRINQLEWMSPGTKQQALEKLSQFTHKIGYPDKWKDYSSVKIQDQDVVKNLMEIASFEHQYQLAKLGKPINRDEWLMPPQMVNAYYNPQMNEIVFPAAILQPPFFDLNADDAVNYGGIGAVIGHEISHGFDDQGSQFDGKGNLRNWWTERDREEFERRAKGLVVQYGSYKPFDDMSVNGELTLGENIGDLGGLNAAYSAYKMSLEGKQAPVIDGFTGDQRFFIGWAQVWRCKYREPELRKRLLTDPHSPTNYRTNGIVSNLDSFYEAFGITPNMKMYISPEKRVRIW